jgi:hypothetical protein
LLRPPSESIGVPSKASETGSGGSEVDQDRKKRKRDDDSDGVSNNGDEKDEVFANEDEMAIDSAQIRRKHARKYNPDLQTRTISVARPVAEMKGHTAFLTFAVAPHVLDRISNKHSADECKKSGLPTSQNESSES